jgi:hypothetical protein
VGKDIKLTASDNFNRAAVVPTPPHRPKAAIVLIQEIFAPE